MSVGSWLSSPDCLYLFCLVTLEGSCLDSETKNENQMESFFLATVGQQTQAEDKGVSEQLAKKQFQIFSSLNMSHKLIKKLLSVISVPTEAQFNRRRCG